MRLNEELGQLGGRLWTAPYGGSLRKNPKYRHDSELPLARSVIKRKDKHQ